MKNASNQAPMPTTPPPERPTEGTLAVWIRDETPEETVAYCRAAFRASMMRYSASQVVPK